MRKTKEFIEFRCKAIEDIHSLPDWFSHVKEIKRRKRRTKKSDEIAQGNAMVRLERKEGDRTCDYCSTKLALLNPSETCWLCQDKLRKREIANEISSIKES